MVLRLPWNIVICHVHPLTILVNLSGPWSLAVLHSLVEFLLFFLLFCIARTISFGTSWGLDSWVFVCNTSWWHTWPDNTRHHSYIANIILSSLTITQHVNTHIKGENHSAFWYCSLLSRKRRNTQGSGIVEDKNSLVLMLHYTEGEDHSNSAQSI